MVGHLILKDWRLQRAADLHFHRRLALIALGVVQSGAKAPMVVGSVWFFIALILVGTMLPLAGIVNERKKQNLAFLMSLPVSSIQYTTAKLVSTVGMFLMPWLTLVIAALLLIETRGIVPHGVDSDGAHPRSAAFRRAWPSSPRAALVGESEGWGIAANVFCSSSYGLIWYFMSRIPGLMADVKSPVPSGIPTVLKILGGEFGSDSRCILGLTYLSQSRKRDFV